MKIFKIMVTIYLIIIALLSNSTSIAQPATVAANPSNVIMAAGSSFLVELMPANCEILGVTSISHDGLQVESYPQGNKSINPVKWLLKLTAQNIQITVNVVIKVLIKLTNGLTSEITITITVTVVLGSDSTCLSPREFPDSMLAIKQDEALKSVQG